LLPRLGPGRRSRRRGAAFWTASAAPPGRRGGPARARGAGWSGPCCGALRCGMACHGRRAGRAAALGGAAAWWPWWWWRGTARRICLVSFKESCAAVRCGGGRGGAVLKQQRAMTARAHADGAAVVGTAGGGERRGLRSGRVLVRIWGSRRAQDQDARAQPVLRWALWAAPPGRLRYLAALRVPEVLGGVGPAVLIRGGVPCCARGRRYTRVNIHGRDGRGAPRWRAAWAGRPRGRCRGRSRQGVFRERGRLYNCTVCMQSGKWRNRTM
jgi:hypothetical protein